MVKVINTYEQNINIVENRHKTDLLLIDLTLFSTQEEEIYRNTEGIEMGLYEL